MKIVTIQEMVDYIMAQPPDRKVNWVENESKNECGCLMIQFARDNNIPATECGITRWYPESTPDKPALPIAVLEKNFEYAHFQPKVSPGSINTYEEIQSLCRERFPGYVKS